MKVITRSDNFVDQKPQARISLMGSVLIKEASFYKAINCKVGYEKHWPMLLMLKTWIWQTEIKEFKTDILGIHKLWWIRLNYCKSDEYMRLLNVLNIWRNGVAVTFKTGPVKYMLNYVQKAGPWLSKSVAIQWISEPQMRWWRYLNIPWQTTRRDTCNRWLEWRN